MLITLYNQQYETVRFSRCLTNKAEAMVGTAVNGFLAVGSDMRIYNTKSGKPLLQGRFSDLKVALDFATWLGITYQDYFEIWTVHPEADLISWCKYSAVLGVEIFEMVTLLEKLSVICKDDIIDAYTVAQRLAPRWKS